MDLFRAILLAVEEQPTGELWAAKPLLGHPLQDVVAHVRLIQEGGLIDARFVGPASNEAAIVLRITNDGYDFIEAAMQPKLWGKAKQLVRASGAPLTVPALKRAFDILISQMLK
jgi:hypothetical protein